MEIYRTQGYTDRDAVSAIVENNLYGLDIDDRAAQLAYFALMMKACEHDRRFLRRGVQPHVCAIAEWNGNQTDDPAWSETQRRAARLLRETFRDAKEYGSILSMPQPLTDALDELGENPFGGEATLGVDAENLQKLAAQAKIMARKYDVVVTNPPYMGSSGMGAKLAEFVKKWYPDSKSDLFAVFMERGRSYTQTNGYLAMITQHAWMFLSSFEKLRAKLMEIDTVNMAHLGPRAFEEIGGEVVQTTAFVMQNRHVHGFKGMYARLIEPTTQDGKEKMYLDGENRYVTLQDSFLLAPGKQIAYWVGKNILELFENKQSLFVTRAGITTGNNDLFIKNWFEIEKNNIYTKKQSDEKCNVWYFHHKGGNYRKWYGNNELVLHYDSNSIRQMKKCQGFRHDGKNDFFKEGGTWNKTGTGNICVRYSNDSYTFNTNGCCLFAKDKRKLLYCIALLNSSVMQIYLSFLCPTFSFAAGDVEKVPIIENVSIEGYVEKITNNNVEISKEDWDSFETSWDFKKHPLI